MEERDSSGTALLTTAQVAATLNVSMRTVYRWTYDGRLPHVKLGGLLRYPADKIRELAGLEDGS